MRAVVNAFFGSDGKTILTHCAKLSAVKGGTLGAGQRGSGERRALVSGQARSANPDLAD